MARDVMRAAHEAISDASHSVLVHYLVRQEPAAGIRALLTWRCTLGSAGKMYQERYGRDREFDTADALRQIAERAGTSLVTLSVARVLANPAITAPIIGASSPKQLAPGLAASQSTIDDEAERELGELTHSYRLGDAPR